MSSKNLSALPVRDSPWGTFFSAKIFFIKGLSTEVDLPEKADVIVSELMGSFGIDEYIVSYLTDAKARFLRVGGKIIPSCIKMFIAPVEAPEIYEEMIGFWEKNLYGIYFSDARQQAVNSPVLQTINPEGILAETCQLSRIDFELLNKAEKIDMDNQVTFRIEREGILHGF